MYNTLSKIWENIDGCAENYIYAIVLYMMSILLQAFSVIIDHGTSSQGHGLEVVDDLNAIELFSIPINFNCATSGCKKL